MNPLRYIQLAMQEGIAITDQPEPVPKRPRLCFEFAGPAAPTLWVYFPWFHMRVPMWLISRKLRRLAQRRTGDAEMPTKI